MHAHDRQGLARLCRYGARGPVAESRLFRRVDGRYACEAKKGVTLVLTAEQLVRRLLWLMPPRGLHLTNFHGAFANHASNRAQVLLPPKAPPPPAAPSQSRGQASAPEPRSAPEAAPLHARQPRVDWASLQRHTFGCDVWQCPRCGGLRRVVAVVTSPRTAGQVLRNLGLWPQAPPPPLRPRNAPWRSSDGTPHHVAPRRPAWLPREGTAYASRVEPPGPWMRFAAGLLLSLAAAGCVFDPRVPTGAVVTCSAASPCPGGFFCQPRLGRCISNGDTDQQAPRVISATFSRTALARGATLTLDLVVSEPLGLAPSVSLAETGATAAMTLANEVDADPPRYEFRYVVGADDVEGPASIYADLVDRVGNEANAVLLGAVTFDFTPPTPASLTFIAPRSADGGLLELRPDEGVQVRLTMSEPVTAGALAASPTDCDGGTVGYVLGSNQAGLLDFAVPPPAGTPGCSYAFHLGGVTDLAGNAQTPSDLVVGAPYRVDDTAPEITGLASYRTGDGGWTRASTFSQRTGYDQVGLRFGLGGSAVAMTASLGGESLPGCDLSSCPAAVDGGLLCSCVRPVGPGDAEGTHPVLVTARDAAGNTRFASLPVVFDFSPPGLLSSGAAPALAKLGDDVIYAVIPTEELAGPPTVTVSGPGSFPLAFLNATYAFHRVTTGLDVDGTYAVAVTMTDRVGNTAVDVAGAAFGVDVSVPTITRLVSQASRYSAVSGFNQVQVELDVAESVDGPGASLAATLDGRPMGCDPYSASSPNYVCRYTVTGTETEGTVPLQVRTLDPAGNGAFASGGVTLDFTAPRLVPGSPQVLLGPPPGCRLGSVGSLGEGATATLQFSLDESVSSAPAVSTSAPESLAFSRLSQTGLTFIYAMTLDGGSHAQGAYGVEVAATDLVGNATSFGLGDAGLQLVVDTVAPAPPAVAKPDAIVYQRVPWGLDEDRDGTFEPKTFRVVGSPGVADGDTSQVRAYDGPDPALAAEIGSVAVVDGGFGTMTLNPADRTEVYVASFDSACNSSAALRVRDVSWTATMGYKVSGSSLENPLVISTTPMLSRRLVQDPTAHLEMGDAQLPSLRSVDAQAVLQAGKGSWSMRGTATPPARFSSAMVYDSARGKFVVFGGWQSIGVPLGDTWEWDPVSGSWSNRTPAVGPSARGESAMAYDSARRKVVLVGGLGLSNGYLDDTWEWDGATGTWIDRTPTSSRPSGRRGHALAYDSARGRVVLFGGNLASGGYAQDTWEWDGKAGAWSARSPAFRPSPRSAHAMAYDHLRRRVVLFGGAIPAVLLQDTWEWDGVAGAWTPRSFDPTPPAGRYGHAMAFDGENGRVVLFGGYGSAGSLQDVWEWSASGEWVERTPVAPPSARYGHGMAFDTGRSMLVVFGGVAAVPGLSPTSDTWEWRAASGVWTDRTAATTNPGGRYGHAMAADPVRGRVVMFSGSSMAQDTWEWDGQVGAWSNRTPATPSPAGRRLYAMAHDGARGRVFVFGGLTSGGQQQDSWAWDGGSWTDLTPDAGSPGARSGAAMAYDPERERMVLFGGLQGGSTMQDTWEWDGASWRNMTPDAGSPPPSRAHAMAYDGVRRKVVAYGLGTGSSPDIWEWDGASGAWTQRVAASSPPARANPAIAYDSTRGKVVMFGGGSRQDTWEWDGATGTWFNHTPVASPVGRFNHAMAFDSATGRVVMFGGAVTGSPDLQDTWEWNGGAQATPGVTLQVPLGATGAASSWTVGSISASFWAGGTGYPAGTATDGAELLLWDHRAWQPIAANADAAGSPGVMQWSTSAPAEIAPLVLPASLVFAVRPSAPNGTGSGAVTVDYAEVTVRYRLP